ncbi:MAG: PHP domain-containing protein, partial [Clostridia bacterium]|nr:PHP domain-containing protein [Clostridia bacterium]
MAEQKETVEKLEKVEQKAEQKVGQKKEQKEKTEATTLKQVKEVFSDYQVQSNIQKAKIRKMSITKKKSTLEIELQSDVYLEIKEIWYFESFLKERFAFQQINVIIKYDDSVQINEIQQEWKNIIAYMTHKYPLMKPMLLLKSMIEVTEEEINVNMHIKGADFLKTRKLDKELENVIKNLFGKTYKINLYEKLTEQEERELEEQNKKILEEVVEHAKEIVRYDKEEQYKNNLQEYEHKENTYDMQNVGDKRIEENEYNQAMDGIPLPEEGEYIPEDIECSIIEESEYYIMGKATRAKEKLVEIKQINAESGRITIEGRIISCECKETRTGKGMIIYEVYDGTGLIICKSFTKDIEEGKEVTEKIQNAKTIKTTGKAQLDTYAGDVTIITNTIIATETDIPEMPEEAEEDTPLILGKNIEIKERLVKVKDLTAEDGQISLDGEIIYMEDRELKSGKTLLSFDLYDGTSTLTCKAFLEKNNAKKIIGRMGKVKGVKISGTAQMDSFSGELTVMANTIIESTGIKKEKREDNANEKRVELHMHTQMSQMDAMTSATDLIKRAISWGMKSIAITDHGVVQAFPEAHKLLKKTKADIKIIYGVEAYLAPDKMPVVTNPKGQSIDTTYCVLDLETTGFSPKTEKITEIGIMKYKDGEVIDEFSCFVNPEKPIPQRVVEVTNITDDMVKDAETIDKVFPKMLDFIKGTVLVAHNAKFDIGFLKHNAKELGYDFDFTYLDTLTLAKDVFPNMKKYKLGKIASELGIKVEVAHRALDDVDTTVKVFRIMLDKIKEKGITKVENIDDYAQNPETKKEAYKKLDTYHAIILA